MNAVLRPGKDNLFSISSFNDFWTGAIAQNLILIDEEQSKEISAPLPTTPVSERPTRFPVLMRSCTFGKRTEKIPVFDYRTLNNYFILFLL